MADGYILEVAFAAPMTEYQALVVADAPNGYWRLDDLTATSGAAGSLTEFGGPISPTASLLPTTTSVARDLNGSSQYYTAADGAPTDLGDVFTLEMWVRRDGGFGSNQRLFSKGTGAYGLYFDTNNKVTFDDVAGTTLAQSSAGIADSNTHHIVATKSGTTRKIYVDGVDVTVLGTNVVLANTATNLFVGAEFIATLFFNGVIDEVAIYPTALSPARVAIHYEAGNPTWTNLTPYMTEVMCRHGKQREIGNTDAGTMTVRLKNQDRRFDPTNTASPYNPNVLPLRQIRLRVEKSAVITPLFRGYVQSWPQEPQGRTMTWTQIECVDGFLPLSRADVGEGDTWPAEHGGARINRILDAAGWPASLRDIDTGVSEIAEMIIPLGSGITALAAILEVADAELGSFFCDGQGRACFHDRHRRRQTAYLTAAATFQDGNSTGFIYNNIVLDTDDDNIWNDIQVTALGGETARAEDSTSQAAYWRRSLTRQVPLSSVSEAQDQAEWLLAQNKDPRGKLREMTLKPRRTESGMWEAVVPREISDHVLVKRWPQKVGTEISQHCSIESTQYYAKPGADRIGDVTVTWSLSTPAPSSVDWWILGDSTYGVLGSTTKLIY